MQVAKNWDASVGYVITIGFVHRTIELQKIMRSKVIIRKEKRRQELAATILLPICLIVQSISRLLVSVLRLEGLAFSWRRASWRTRLEHLGKYSDISPHVTVKCPSRLRIGIRSCVGTGSFLDATGNISIGDYVMISHTVSINSHSHPTSPPYHREITAPVVIRDHVWIGAHSVILEGVEVGEGAIVAAGAVVTRSVPAWTIVAGVPAREIRKIQPES